MVPYQSSPLSRRSKAISAVFPTCSPIPSAWMRVDTRFYPLTCSLEHHYPIPPTSSSPLTFFPKVLCTLEFQDPTLGRCPGLIAGAGGSSVNQCARQDGHSTSGSEAWDGSAPIHLFIYFFMKKLTPVPSPHLRCFSALPSACFARNGGEEGLWRVREQ